MTTQDGGAIWDRLATTWNMILTIGIAGLAIIVGIANGSFGAAVGVFVVLMFIAVLRGIAFELTIWAIAAVGVLIVGLFKGARKTQ